MLKMALDDLVGDVVWSKGFAFSLPHLKKMLGQSYSAIAAQRL